MAILSSLSFASPAYVPTVTRYNDLCDFSWPVSANVLPLSVAPEWCVSGHGLTSADQMRLLFSLFKDISVVVTQKILQLLLTFIYLIFYILSHISNFCVITMIHKYTS